MVPPNQAEMIVDALAAKGVPVAYLDLPRRAARVPAGRQHPQALDSELSFYAQVFGFAAARRGHRAGPGGEPARAGHAAGVKSSSVSRLRLASRPPVVAGRGVRSAPTTRWQGTTTASGLAPLAAPTPGAARVPNGLGQGRVAGGLAVGDGGQRATHTPLEGGARGRQRQVERPALAGEVLAELVSRGERGGSSPPPGVDGGAGGEADAGDAAGPSPGEDEVAHRGGNDGEHGVGHALSTSGAPRFVRLVRAGTPGHTGAMARILVTEKIADGGLQRLRDAGHVVDVRLGLNPEELIDVVHGAAALIIRSATQVTREVLEPGTDLVVVGRAGIGLDNVDVDAATERGVMVVNAPQSNILSAAEHTMALLLAQARNIPQAHAALVEGRWERSRWEGVELSDKTLGVVGLGRIGKLVAQRALAFGMRLVAYDPFVSARAGPPDERRADVARAAGRGQRLRHPARGQDPGDGGADRQGPAGPGQARGSASSTWPGAASSTRRRWRRRSGTATSAGAALDVFSPSPPSTRRCSASPGGGHAPPGRQHPRGAGQGGRHRSPSRSAWPWRASSCRSR